MKIIERNYVVALPLDHGDNLLLQRKDNAYRFWPNYWCTFGGGIKEGENLTDTLLREMREENGLILTDINLFTSHDFSDFTKVGDPINRRGTVHYFGAKFDGDLTKVRLKEGAGFSTFDRNELWRYNKFGLIVPYNYEVIDRFMNSISQQS